MMAGEGTADGMGFHQIAMQIAITANALGKKEEEVLALSAGLLENHVSDGSRYNTPAKRKTELQRMLRYCEGNVCYSYSSGALKKLVPGNQPTPDLDGLPETADAVTGVGAAGNDDGLLGGVFMTEMGVYRKTEDANTKNRRRYSRRV